MRKPVICICENKTQISFAVTVKLNSAFVFATRIVQFLYFLNPKFQASSYLLWLYSPVCVGPGRKPQRRVFSEQGSSFLHQHLNMHTTRQSAVCGTSSDDGNLNGIGYSCQANKMHYHTIWSYIYFSCIT